MVYTFHQVTVAASARRVAELIIDGGRACYESNIDIVTRFMVDTNIVGGGWISFVGSDVAYTDITVLDHTKDWAKVHSRKHT